MTKKKKRPSEIKMICSKCKLESGLQVMHHKDCEFWVFCSNCKLVCANFDCNCRCKKPRDFYFTSLNEIAYGCWCNNREFRILALNPEALMVADLENTILNVPIPDIISL